MSAKRTGRFLELDCLRGLAAFTVLVAHYTATLAADYHCSIGPFKRLQGHWAVWLFFVISGFVIFMTLEKTGRALDFIVSRCSRLYPAYWAGVLFTSLIFVLLGPPASITGSQFAWNLTMVQEWFFVPSVDGVYWTLVAELAFYVIMLVLFRTGLLAHIRLVACVWLGAVVAHAGLESCAGLDLPEIVRLTFLLRFAGLFIAGMVFYQIRTGPKSAWNHVLIAACFLATFLTFLSAKQSRLDLVMLFMIFGTFYLFICGRLGLLVRAPLVFLGWISYPLYLIHCDAGRLLIRNLHDAGLSAPLAALLTTGLVVLTATGIAYFVEKPTLKFVRDRYAAWKVRASHPVLVAAAL
jgi:peptidoglycan/LPS O-acetylase OafA/YrhL